MEEKTSNISEHYQNLQNSAHFNFDDVALSNVKNLLQQRKMIAKQIILGANYSKNNPLLENLDYINKNIRLVLNL